jgi:cytochrome c biogenesis protein CcmG/thiol:disulfide interchange protein DsbE
VWCKPDMVSRTHGSNDFPTPVSTARSAKTGGRRLALAAFGLAVACSATGSLAQTTSQPLEVNLLDRPAPDIEARLLNGKTVRSKDLRGKVVIAVFWATWSPAARADLPNIDRFVRQNAARGLYAIGFSIDENSAEVRAFWKKAGYAFPAAMRDDGIFRHYGRVSTTPLYYVIDRKGIVRERISGPVGPERLEKILGPLLDQPSR